VLQLAQDAGASGDRASLYTAVITAAVAVVLAVAGQVETARRDRLGRRYERRRDALLDVQDAALEVRRALREYGTALRAAVEGTHGPLDLSAPRADDRAYSDARARLEVRTVRLDDDPRGRAVAEALRDWSTTSQEHFLSSTEVPTATEQSAWQDLNEAVAEALRH